MRKEKAAQKAIQYKKWAKQRQIKGKITEDNYFKWTRNFDWTEPVKIGHHSQKRHHKLFEKRNNEMRKIIDNEKIIKRMLEKANNLEIFANTHKGDAAKKRDQRIINFDSKFKLGDNVNWFGRNLKIIKINVKTVKLENNILSEKHLLMINN